jgi:L-aspartate oxidase
LASNSLLEAMVFAHRSAMHSIRQFHLGEISATYRPAGKDIPDWDARGTTNPREMILITQSLKELQLLMSDYVGIVRNNVRLQRAMRRLDLLHEEIEELYRTTVVSPQLCELRNMITTGYLIVKCAQFRHESRGLHFNTDYPAKDPLTQNIVM